MIPSRRFPWPLFTRTVLLQTLVVVFALGILGLGARYFFKHKFISQVESQLHITLDSLSHDLPIKPPQTWCGTRSHRTAFRLTVIAYDGKVLCDSHHDEKSMENHLTRPEVQSALKTGYGQSIRFSDTLNADMLYGAVDRNSGQLILRGAIPLSTLSSTLNTIDTYLIFFLAITAIILGLFFIWSGRRIALPIGHLETSLDDIQSELASRNERLRQEREEQATLISAISDAVLAVDTEGSLLFYNSRFAVLFATLFGRPKGLQDGDKRLSEIFRDPEILNAFREAIKHGKQISVGAIELRKAFFSLSVAPLRRPSTSEVYGAVGIFHDVTDLKRMEQIRIDFVANASHELRTPLTAIKGYFDTLSQDVKEGRPITKDFIDVISRNTDRLMSLVNDLLDLSSLESNAEDLQKSHVSTEEISARVLKQLQGAFREKLQTIRIEAKVPTIYADPRRLEQVLVNLLDNASKYTPSGGSIVLLWKRDEQEPSSNDTLVSVTDTGPGIAMEHQGRLFERFHRVDKARSRELGGTGLGLAIVKHIMQRHGGSIWVESTLGHGAKFICRFPSAPAV